MGRIIVYTILWSVLEILIAFAQENTLQTLSNNIERRQNDLMNVILATHNGTLRGVNLGGWFIPEYWMVDFYEGTNYTDMCSFGTNNRSEANKRIQDHLASWIVESDFQWLQTQGVNTIRLPVGYWNIINDPYDIYFPIDSEVSIRYIQQIFTWASSYGMSVLLDLHGAPGSQNGNDHSGCGNGIVGWNTESNRELTLTTITEMVKLFGKEKNLLGFELMNEPAYSLENENHEDLLSYYQDAYTIIREYSSTALIAFNVLYSQFYTIWDSELKVKDGYYGIITDWHLYDCFGDQASYTTEQHIQDAENWGPMIEKHNLYHPIYVGEWSLATGTNPGGQEFADAELTSFQNGIGWHFWSYRLASDKDSTEWSFKSALEHGYVL